MRPDRQVDVGIVAHAGNGHRWRDDAANYDRYASAAFQRSLAELRRLARSNSVPLLIEGESGTGKTIVARHIHSRSPRARASFHSVNVGSLDDSLSGSELFGHVTGAFTDARQTRAGHFASANGGTLFLDEIGKAGTGVQRKLLHVIESGEMRPVGSDRTVQVDVRVVAACNRPLGDLADEGLFLPDLYARLQVFRVKLPPLRERRADIPLLVGDAVEAHHRECGYVTRPDVAPELMDALKRAPWPHNLRELDATMHRILLDAEEAPILDLRHCMGCLGYLRALGGRPASFTDADMSDAVRRTGSVAKAARELGVDRGTIYRRRRQCSITDVAEADDR